jgi:hypothetical protein
MRIQPNMKKQSPSRALCRLAVCVCLLATLCAHAQEPNRADQPATDALIRQITDNEAAYLKHRPDYFFLQEERSDRTGQHLWVEAIAETPHGPLRRLLLEDGKPLAADRQQQIDAHVHELATHPALMDQVNRNRMADERQGEQMLTLSPQMWLYQRQPSPPGTLKFHFVPNPAYVPKTYAERVLQAMAGELYVDEKAMRMREVDASLTAAVKFGWGLLGSVDQGKVHLVRLETSHGDFKPQALDMNLDGRMLLFRTIGKTQHMVRKDFVLMGDHASLADAERMVMAATPQQAETFAHE